jgi:hypothetical protein
MYLFADSYFLGATWQARILRLFINIRIPFVLIMNEKEWGKYDPILDQDIEIPKMI